MNLAPTLKWARMAAWQLAHPDSTARSQITADTTRREVATQLIEFVRRSAEPLAEGQRFPLSTEIIESAFGLFKQLERQHSQGGFTSLLAAFGALLQPTPPASIRIRFARTSVKQLRTWVQQNLPTTLASQRQTADTESKTATA